MVINTIYKATNSINGKVYIGFDSSWPNRKRVHKSASKTGDCKFYRAIRKYGWDNFVWEVLYQALDKNHTKNIMESHFIEQYDSYNNGYNSTKGGDGTFGLVLSEEARQAISEKNRIPKPLSGNRTTDRKGPNNPRFGKPGTFRGKKHTKETIEKLKQPKANKDNMENLPLSKSVECPHCGKTGQLANMKRWHLDNCKER